MSARNHPAVKAARKANQVLRHQGAPRTVGRVGECGACGRWATLINKQAPNGALRQPICAGCVEKVFKGVAALTGWRPKLTWAR